MLSDRCLSMLSVLSVLSVMLVYCGQTFGRLEMKLGFGPGHIVLGGEPAPTPPKGHSPQFSANIGCGQMAAWIKMPLGMELGLGPGDFVLDGDPAPPNFSAHVYCRQTAGWMKLVLGMEVGLSPGDFVLDGRALCVRWGPSHSPKFSAHVYYSYCDFVRTLHMCKALLVCSSLSLSLVFYAYHFLESLIVLVCSTMHSCTTSADS